MFNLGQVELQAYFQPIQQFISKANAIRFQKITNNSIIDYWQKQYDNTLQDILSHHQEDDIPTNTTTATTNTNTKDHKITSNNKNNKNENNNSNKEKEIHHYYFHFAPIHYTEIASFFFFTKEPTPHQFYATVKVKSFYIWFYNYGNILN